MLMAMPGLFGQQCKQPSDCTSPHAPHCSRWGWCQWTADYGEEGPREDLPTTGYCNSNKDCVPRAPFCSRQGYCTQRPGQRGKQSGRTKNKTGNNKSRTDHNEGRQERVGQMHSTPEGRPHKKSQIRNPSANNRGQQSQRRSQQDRVAHKRLTGQMRPHPEAVQKPRGQVRPSPDRGERPRGSVRPSPVAVEEPRGRGVLPSGTFLLSQMNTGFGQRRIDTVQQEPRNFQDLPPRKPVTRPEPQKLQPAPRNFRVGRPEPQKFQPPPPPPPPTPAKTTPPPAPVFAERRQEPIDRQSSDYGHTYDYVDYSNYDYYTDFEVQKTQPKVLSYARGEGRRLPQEEPLILENPPEGQSQGCLYDCVYDCVSITQLEAYRDCVDFCGKTCTDKK